jgi:integrase
VGASHAARRAARCDRRTLMRLPGAASRTVPAPYPEGNWSIQEPKTDRSRRQVLLTSAALDALRRHRQAQAEERRRLGQVWQDNDLVFANTIGSMTRHTTATLLWAEDVPPKIVRELLGHTQVSITLDRYSHVTATMQQAAVSALDGLLGSQLGSQESR